MRSSSATKPRFIPAYTGNTSTDRASQKCQTVHPRIHGEHTGEEKTLECICGSSPHTRGTRQSTTRCWWLGRFIPAYTGNTSGLKSPAPRRAVHPRIHGEHSDIAGITVRLAGSSPHTRGTLCAAGGAVAAGRFIPAYTGNTPFIEESLASPAGSSPHTRGTLIIALIEARMRRFIPAYTGNTSDSTPCTTYNPVHPRIHGEHKEKARKLSLAAGSSPHTRGTLRYRGTY